MSKLILIRGLPGSGKSTLAESMADVMECGYYEADMWFDRFNDGKFDATKLGEAHLWCQNQVILEAQYENDVIVSNTSTTEKEVEVYRKIAEDQNAEFISIIVENRHGNKSIHDVPDYTMTAMRNRFSVKL